MSLTKLSTKEKIGVWVDLVMMVALGFWGLISILVGVLESNVILISLALINLTIFVYFYKDFRRTYEVRVEKKGIRSGKSKP